MGERGMNKLFLSLSGRVFVFLIKNLKSNFADSVFNLSTAPTLNIPAKKLFRTT